ncbi:hypothetical protein [Pseudotabrizicola sp.]|uniref:hypothetical protein n=1 Tax=Pseudotabrizicola sp. TaxID=2939647 RepID=UPI00271EEEDB|nr:hypothetical protein [Pseudotabrizicola sp.]MDO8882652.1 hypothetical protein [Pseudotabrizicola sp.]
MATSPARIVALVLALVMMTGPGGARPPSPSEQAMAAGDMQRARQLAQQQLQVNPNDTSALAVLAAADLAQQRPKAARQNASKAFAAGETHHDRFVAARLAAKSAHLGGQPLVAQYWLRRAVHVAPHPQAEQVAIADFRALRRVSPLHLSFAASFRPSANVNNGAENPMLSIDGVPTYFVFNDASRALPGAETRLGLGLRYRLAGTEKRGTDLGIQMTQSAIFLTDRARRIAPMARGADFATASVDLQLSRYAEISERSFLRGGLQIGQSWLAGDAYARRAKLDAALTHRLSPVVQARLSMAVERQWRIGASPAATALVVDSAAERKLASGDVIGIRFTAGKTVSDDANQENHSLASELRYVLGDTVAGVHLSGTLGLALRDYPVFFGGVFGDSGRQDKTAFGSIDLSLTRLKALGFEPVISLEGRRTRSNVSRFESNSLGLGVRIKSSF